MLSFDPSKLPQAVSRRDPPEQGIWVPEIQPQLRKLSSSVAQNVYQHPKCMQMQLHHDGQVIIQFDYIFRTPVPPGLVDLATFLGVVVGNPKSLYGATGEKRCRSEAGVSPHIDAPIQWRFQVSGEGIFMSYRSVFKVHALHLKLYEVSAMCCGQPRWSHVSKNQMVSNIEGETVRSGGRRSQRDMGEDLHRFTRKKEVYKIGSQRPNRESKYRYECFQRSHPRTSRTASIHRITNKNISYSKEAVSNVSCPKHRKKWEQIQRKLDPSALQ